jgi:hypothetical protein
LSSSSCASQDKSICFFTTFLRSRPSKSGFYADFNKTNLLSGLSFRKAREPSLAENLLIVSGICLVLSSLQTPLGPLIFF